MLAPVWDFSQSVLTSALEGFSTLHLSSAWGAGVAHQSGSQEVGTALGVHRRHPPAPSLLFFGSPLQAGGDLCFQPRQVMGGLTHQEDQCLCVPCPSSLLIPRH